MAVSHITYNHSTPHGSQLANHLLQLEGGLEGLNDDLATMARMIDGDGSQASHFTYMTGKYGFESDAVAKAAYEELQSAAAKLNTNSSVTDVNAALLQAFAKFR